MIPLPHHLSRRWICLRIAFCCRLAVTSFRTAPMFLRSKYLECEWDNVCGSKRQENPSGQCSNEETLATAGIDFGFRCPYPRVMWYGVPAFC